MDPVDAFSLLYNVQGCGLREDAMCWGIGSHKFEVKSSNFVLHVWGRAIFCGRVFTCDVG